MFQTKPHYFSFSLSPSLSKRPPYSHIARSVFGTLFRICPLLQFIPIFLHFIYTSSIALNKLLFTHTHFQNTVYRKCLQMILPPVSISQLRITKTVDLVHSIYCIPSLYSVNLPNILYIYLCRYIYIYTFIYVYIDR